MGILTHEWVIPANLCENGMCHGEVLVVEGTGQEGQIDSVVVLWYLTCGFHAYSQDHTYSYTADELLSIRQLQRNAQK